MSSPNVPVLPAWYQPDPTWEVLGIPAREAYAERLVVAGRFHAGVPDDVVKFCATASHLLAQAWYHYPLYDEGLNKLLFAVELAVKLRCQQLGLPAGRVRRQSWQERSAYLCAREPQKGHLLGARLDQIRQHRNAEAHPDRYHFGGMAFHRHIVPLFNLLNTLFMDEAALVQATTHVAALQAALPAAGQLLGLHWRGQQLVLDRAEPRLASRGPGGWRVIWVCYPFVPQLSEAVAAHRLCAPLVLTLADPVAVADGITGHEVENPAALVTLTAAPAALTQALLPSYRAAWERADPGDRQLFTFMQESEAAYEVEKQLHQHCWLADPNPPAPPG